MGVINVKRIKPLFNNIVTTADVYEDDVTRGGVVVVPRGELKEYQKVVAAGSSVRDVKVGDLVKIKLDRFMRMRHQKGSFREEVVEDNPVIEVNLPKVVVGGEVMLALTDMDVEYVVEEYDEEPCGGIVVPAGVGIKVAASPKIDTSRLRGPVLM